MDTVEREFITNTIDQMIDAYAMSYSELKINRSARNNMSLPDLVNQNLTHFYRLQDKLKLKMYLSDPEAQEVSLLGGILKLGPKSG